jgi:hypothetical protein
MPANRLIGRTGEHGDGRMVELMAEARKRLWHANSHVARNWASLFQLRRPYFGAFWGQEARPGLFSPR